jgi:hypothetical protein
MGSASPHPMGASVIHQQITSSHHTTHHTHKQTNKQTKTKTKTNTNKQFTISITKQQLNSNSNNSLITQISISSFTSILQ